MTRVIEVSIKDVARVLRKHERERVQDIERGIREAVRLGAEYVASSLNPQKIVDTGALKASIRAKGTEIIADAPHAAIIELGARPHWAPLAPILDWVKRHMKSFGLKRPRRLSGAALDNAGAEALARHQQRMDEFTMSVMDIANAIRAKIAKHGSRPRWYMRNAQPELKRILKTVVERRIRA